MGWVWRGGWGGGGGADNIMYVEHTITMPAYVYSVKTPVTLTHYYALILLSNVLHMQLCLPTNSI